MRTDYLGSLIAATIAAGCVTARDPLSIEWTSETITNPGATRCVTVALANSQAEPIRELAIDFAGAESVIVYRGSDDELIGEATPCAPLAAGDPLVVARASGSALSLPAGVSFTFMPHQRLRLEFRGDGSPTTISIVARRGAAGDAAAGLLHVATRDFELPPNAATVTDGWFAHTPLHQLSFVGVVGHTGELGAGVQVSIADSATADRVFVYAPASHRWFAPSTVVREPFRVRGGFYAQCQYYNPTARTIDATDERGEVCGFWAYYFPAQGDGCELVGDSMVCSR